MTWSSRTPYTTVISNNTIHKLELHEKTNGGSKLLRVLESKPQVKEDNINDEPTGESNSFEAKILDNFELKIMDDTDVSFKVVVKKHDDPLTQYTLHRALLMDNPRIIMEYREEQGLLDWHPGPNIHFTTDSKRPYEKKQKPKDPIGEHPAKGAAKDVKQSRRKPHRQLFPDPKESQHMILRSESIEPDFPENVTPKTRKRKFSSNTLDLRGTTDSKGSCEKECKPNDPDGDHPTKRTKANHYKHDGKQSPYKT